MVQKKIRTEIPTGQIRNTITATIERIYAEMGAQINHPSAQDKALNVTTFIKYGIGAEFSSDPMKIREHEFNPPLCRRCR